MARSETAQIDSTTEVVLQQRFGVEAYPSLYFLKNGETRECHVPRTLKTVSLNAAAIHCHCTAPRQNTSMPWASCSCMHTADLQAPWLLWTVLLPPAEFHNTCDAAVGVCGGRLARGNAGAAVEVAGQPFGPHPRQAAHVRTGVLSEELNVLYAEACYLHAGVPTVFLTKVIQLQGALQCEKGVPLPPPREEVWRAHPARRLPLHTHPLR